MTGSVLTYEGDPAHPNITVTCDVHSVAGPGVTRVVQVCQRIRAHFYYSETCL